MSFLHPLTQWAVTLCVLMAAIDSQNRKRALEAAAGVAVGAAASLIDQSPISGLMLLWLALLLLLHVLQRFIEGDD